MYMQYSDINLYIFFFHQYNTKNIVRYITKMYMQYSDINLYFYSIKIYNFLNSV